MTKMKNYKELCHFSTFQERFNYLKLIGKVGEDTFGRHRPVNQLFYRSPKWKKVRDDILLRDNGCDLGLAGYETGKYAIVHHINPITEDDIFNDRDCLYDPDNLITVRFDTHNAIHWGDESVLKIALREERTPNDMCPWKR